MLKSFKVGAELLDVTWVLNMAACPIFLFAMLCGVVSFLSIT